MKKHESLYLAVALIVTTIIFGTIYVTQQQSLRISANNPQIQLAVDTAADLDNGMNPITIADKKIDLNISLATFVIIYSKTGHTISGDGYLNNKIPTAPLGVLRNSDGKDYGFVTWQPQKNVRIASVTVSSKNYYVLSGRSLKEVEKQEQTQLQFATLGWLGSVFVIILGLLIDKKFSNKHVEK
jgi:hypothetical protein